MGVRGQVAVLESKGLPAKRVSANNESQPLRAGKTRFFDESSAKVEEAAPSQDRVVQSAPGSLL